MKPIKEEILLGLLPNAKNGPSNQIISNCPWCGKEKHFFVNKGFNYKGILHGYDCKKCGVTGSVYTLLAKLNALYLIEGDQIDHEKLNKFDFEKQNESFNFAEIEIPNKELPSKSVDIIDINSEQYQYLLKRKFTDIDFQLYLPKYNKFRKYYKDYIIIPIYQDFEIKGFVSRYIGDNEDSLRYKNSKDTEFSMLLGGFDEITNKTTTLILVEGFFDKTSVTTELGLHYIDEMKCCCTFGKKISDYQIWLILNKTNVKNIILMYDASDAVKSMKKYSLKMKDYFNVKLAYTGYDKDPGELNKKEFELILQNLMSPSEFFLKKIQKKKF